MGDDVDRHPRVGEGDRIDQAPQALTGDQEVTGGVVRVVARGRHPAQGADLGRPAAPVGELRHVLGPVTEGGGVEAEDAATAAPGTEAGDEHGDPPLAARHRQRGARLRAPVLCTLERRGAEARGSDVSHRSQPPGPRSGVGRSHHGRRRRRRGGDGDGRRGHLEDPGAPTRLTRDPPARVAAPGARPDGDAPDPRTVVSGRSSPRLGRDEVDVGPGAPEEARVDVAVPGPGAEVHPLPRGPEHLAAGHLLPACNDDALEEGVGGPEAVVVADDDVEGAPDRTGEGHLPGFGRHHRAAGAGPEVDASVPGAIGGGRGAPRVDDRAVDRGQVATGRRGGGR
jgi:hypothetical protein